jgi:hypothetical protein
MLYVYRLRPQSSVQYIKCRCSDPWELRFTTALIKSASHLISLGIIYDGSSRPLATSDTAPSEQTNYYY